MRVLTTLALATVFALGAVVATAMACGGVTAAEAGYTHCPWRDATIYHVRVKDTSCKQAKSVVKDMGSISKTFTVGDFKCRRLNGSSLAGTWRCTNGLQRFRFEFAD